MWQSVKVPIGPCQNQSSVGRVFLHSDSREVRVSSGSLCPSISHYLLVINLPYLKSKLAHLQVSWRNGLLSLAFKIPIGTGGFSCVRICTALHLSSLKKIEFQDILPCQSPSEKSIKIRGLPVLQRTL